MSRIRFEWEVEADTIDQSDGEDPQLKRVRRQMLYRRLVLVALLAVACLLGGLALHLRLVQVRNEIAQQLIDTIKVEVAALRIGDRGTFLQIQSGDDNWLAEQSTLFEKVQAQKAADTIELSGDILSVTIEGERARVLVREDVNGLPYARLSFYARADGVWRHAAPDFAFWGERQQDESSRVIVRYRDADASFAQQLVDDLAMWLEAQCAALGCDSGAQLQIDIVPEAEEAMTWLSAGRLVIRSPYRELVRADRPLDSERAALLYELVSNNWDFQL